MLREIHFIFCSAPEKNYVVIWLYLYKHEFNIPLS